MSRIIAILTVFLAAAFAPLSAQAGDASRLMVKSSFHEQKSLSTNPVASRAQAGGQHWINGFCGPEECLKSRWVMKKRITQMRPHVRVQDASGSGSRAYVSR